jgi:CheY-like chemotaxis protein
VPHLAILRFYAKGCDYLANLVHIQATPYVSCIETSNPMKKNAILWADDDADDLQMMREILLKNNKDSEIIEVSNGKQAINYLLKASESDLPCLIILDINMPVMDGKETLTLIKQNERLSQIPVVIFTTSASELDRLFCKKMKTEMITKPPNFESLEAAVMKLLSYCRS